MILNGWPVALLPRKPRNSPSFCHSLNNFYRSLRFQSGYAGECQRATRRSSPCRHVTNRRSARCHNAPLRSLLSLSSASPHGTPAALNEAGAGSGRPWSLSKANHHHFALAHPTIRIRFHGWQGRGLRIPIASHGRKRPSVLTTIKIPHSLRRFLNSRESDL